MNVLSKELVGNILNKVVLGMEVMNIVVQLVGGVVEGVFIKNVSEVFVDFMFVCFVMD